MVRSTGNLSRTINCYKEPVGPRVDFTHIFFAPGVALYPAGALTASLRPPAGMLATLGDFDIQISLALHLPCRHLAINLS